MAVVTALSSESLNFRLIGSHYITDKLRVLQIYVENSKSESVLTF